MHVDTPFAQSMHSLSAIIQFVGGFCWILGILHSERKLNEKRNNHFSSSTVQMFDEEGGLMMREMKSEGREGEQNENTQNEGILIESESENMERMEMETRTDTTIQENNNFNAFYHEKTVFQTVFPGFSALCSRYHLSERFKVWQSWDSSGLSLFKSLQRSEWRGKEDVCAGG